MSNWRDPDKETDYNLSSGPVIKDSIEEISIEEVLDQNTIVSLPQQRTHSVSLLSVVVIAIGLIFSLAVGFYSINIRLNRIENLIATPSYLPNSLSTYFDFESTNNDQPSVDITILDDEGVSVSALSDGTGFPGFISNELSVEYALQGVESIKVTTSVSEKGTYRGYLYGYGSVSRSYGIVAYVLLPELPEPMRLEYIQLCVPSHGWICSEGTAIIPGEWTPIVIDLSKAYNGQELYNQTLTELAIQWRFSTESSASFSLYFDAMGVFQPEGIK